MEIKVGDIVQFIGQAEDDQTTYLVIDVLGDGMCVIQEVCNRMLKVERVVDVERLKVLF